MTRVPAAELNCLSPVKFDQKLNKENLLSRKYMVELRNFLTNAVNGGFIMEEHF